MSSEQPIVNGSAIVEKMAFDQSFVFKAESYSLAWHYLHQALAQESKQPKMHLAHKRKDFTEITTSMRDSFSQVLRCLKVWFDVSPECLFLAINAMDRFLAKMKIKPKHLACIAVSCFHLAMRITGKPSKAANLEDILTISQTKCTVSDTTRMEEIIMKKLDCDLAAVNPLNFISLFCGIYNFSKPVDYPVISKTSLLQKLEILICNYSCAEFRSSVLALALFSHILENLYICAGIQLVELNDFISSLQSFVMITDEEISNCRQVIMTVLDGYDQQRQFPLCQRQRLIWKLSRRTLHQLKPTARITSILPTIEEAELHLLRNRHDSDSDGMGGSDVYDDITDEDGEDWDILGFWRINVN